jgi:predicted Zn-dependent peptidase
MEIKKLDKWKYRTYGSTNHLFQFENGVRLVVCEYPTSQEFVMHVIIHGGSYVEEQLGVENGTAHFVEHMLTNPNNHLETFDEQDHYRFGTKKRPSIFTNAATTIQDMRFYGNVHKAGSARLVDDLTWQIQYPIDRLPEFIERERKIILAEEARDKRDGRDKGLHLTKFVLKDKYKDFQRKVIGTEKSIKKISLKDILKYINNVFVPERVIIAIQMDKLPDKKLMAKIEELANSFTSDKADKKLKLSYKHEELNNKYDVTHFKDTDYKNLLLQGFIVIPELEGNKYTPEMMKELVLRDIVSSVIGYRLFKKLREENHLVYNADTYSSYLTRDWIASGFIIECQVENLVEVLKETSELLDTDIESFLYKSEGQKWLTNYISSLIFKLNTVYSRDVSKSIALDVVSGVSPYKWDSVLYSKTVKQIKINEIVEYYLNKIKGNKLRFWAYSPYDDKLIINTIKGCNLGK